MEQTEALAVLEASGALLSGHFELRSGLHSDRFFQCANVLASPPHAEQLCRALVDRFRLEHSDVTVDLVLAPALGGILVGHEVARSLGVRSIFAEKQDGRLVLRRFELPAGAAVVIAEDVITRGGRVQETVDIVLQAGAQVAGIVLLVNRSGGTVSFPYPTTSLVQLEPVTWEPEQCPLCRNGLPLEHPGS